MISTARRVTTSAVFAGAAVAAVITLGGCKDSGSTPAPSSQMMAPMSPPMSSPMSPKMSGQMNPRDHMLAPSSAMPGDHMHK